MNLKKFVLPVCALLATAGTIAQPQQPRPPKPPSNEERLKHVSEKISKEITLTAAQRTKVESAYKDFFVQMDKLRSKNKSRNPGTPPPPPPPPPPGTKEEVDKLARSRDARIKAALSEAQYKKYTEIEASLRPPRKP